MTWTTSTAVTALGLATLAVAFSTGSGRKSLPPTGETTEAGTVVAGAALLLNVAQPDQPRARRLPRSGKPLTPRYGNHPNVGAGGGLLLCLLLVTPFALWAIYTERSIPSRFALALTGLVVYGFAVPLLGFAGAALATLAYLAVAARARGAVMRARFPSWERRRRRDSRRKNPGW